jgi:DNA-directed RNA polymerase specialized sigma24 family protein
MAQNPKRSETMIAYEHTDSRARFLYEKAGFAAYCAYRRLGLDPDRDFEDTKQEAVLTFWDTYRRENNERYAFVAARNAALESLVRHNNPYALSLDFTMDVDDDSWIERLPVASEQDSRSDWLSDADLQAVVTEVFTTPASPQAVEEYRRLLRHQMEGYSLSETAATLGKTVNATKALRRRLTLKLAAKYSVAPSWEAVAPQLGKDRDLDSTLQAICKTPPPSRTVAHNAAILRLLMQDYDTAAIATELGRSEDAIKGARKVLKQRLTAHCRSLGIEPPAYNHKGGGWRPAHHYGNHDGRPKRSK